MEKKLALIKKLMEMGADIEITVAGTELTESEALSLAREASGIAGNPVETAESFDYKWFKVRSTYKSKFGVSLFHQNSRKGVYEA